MNKAENKFINHLKLKYGQSIEKILAYKGEKQAYLDSLNNYNLMREETKTKLDKEQIQALQDFIDHCEE